MVKLTAICCVLSLALVIESTFAAVERPAESTKPSSSGNEEAISDLFDMNRARAFCRQLAYIDSFEEESMRHYNVKRSPARHDTLDARLNYLFATEGIRFRKRSRNDQTNPDDLSDTQSGASITSTLPDTSDKLEKNKEVTLQGLDEEQGARYKKMTPFMDEGIRFKKSPFENEGVRFKKSPFENEGVRFKKSPFENEGVRFKKSPFENEGVRFKKMSQFGDEGIRF